MIEYNVINIQTENMDHENNEVLCCVGSAQIQLSGHLVGLFFLTQNAVFTGKTQGWNQELVFIV